MLDKISLNNNCHQYKISPLAEARFQQIKSLGHDSVHFGTNDTKSVGEKDSSKKLLGALALVVAVPLIIIAMKRGRVKTSEFTDVQHTGRDSSRVVSGGGENTIDGCPNVSTRSVHHTKEQQIDAYMTYLDYPTKSETLTYMESVGESGRKNLDEYYNGDLFNVITHNGEFKNNEHYTNVLLNVLEKPNETKKINSIALELSKKYDEISSALRGSLSNLPESLRANHYNDCQIEQNSNLSSDIKVFVLRDLIKKKYYAANKSGEGTVKYSLADPLVSQKARQEIIDTHLGWDLLQKDFFSEDKFCLVDLLSDKHSFSKEEQDLITKLLRASTVSGANSEVHSHELNALGKIFREKANISVD